MTEGHILYHQLIYQVILAFTERRIGIYYWFPIYWYKLFPDDNIHSMVMIIFICNIFEYCCIQNAGNGSILFLMLNLAVLTEVLIQTQYNLLEEWNSNFQMVLGTAVMGVYQVVNLNILNHILDHENSRNMDIKLQIIQILDIHIMWLTIMLHQWKIHHFKVKYLLKIFIYQVVNILNQYANSQRINNITYVQGYINTAYIVHLVSINIIKLNVYRKLIETLSKCALCNLAIPFVSTTNTLLCYEYSRTLMVIIFIQIKQILDIGILVVLSFIITTFLNNINTKIYHKIANKLSIIGLTIIFDEHLKRSYTDGMSDIWMCIWLGDSDYQFCVYWLFILAFNKSFCMFMKALMETGRYIAYNKPKEHII